MDREQVYEAEAAADCSMAPVESAGAVSTSSNGADAVRQSAVSALHNNPNYLLAIASLASACPVWAVRPVVSEQQQVLLQERQMLGSDFYQAWSGQRLTHALDEALAVSQPVDVPVLLAHVQHLQLSHPLVQAITKAMGLQHSMMQEAVRQMVWPARAAFQLAVMRAHLPQLYEHSVLNMLVAVFLASQQGWNEAQCARVAAAGLLHDVGMLYLPPAWKDPNYQLSLQERVQLSAHPVLGCAVIASMQVYPRSVEEAVLEHHERMDGGGYPRHMQAEDISPMGRILMVAEVVSGLYEKFADMPAERLSLLLRMNTARYPQDLVASVLALLRPSAVVEQSDPESASEQLVPLPDHSTLMHEVMQLGRQLALAQQYWTSCKNVLPAQWRSQRGAAAVEYIDRSMHTLQLSLADSGADVRQQSDWAQLLQHDPQTVQELALIVREARWQIERCTHTCAQRWPRLMQVSNNHQPPSRPESVWGRQDAPSSAESKAHNAALSIVERALGTWLHSVANLLAAEGSSAQCVEARSPPDARSKSELEQADNAQASPTHG